VAERAEGQATGLLPSDPKLDDLRVRAGWLLVTRSGSTGVVATVPTAWDGFAMSEHIIRIVPNPDAMSSAWLYAYLRSNIGRRALARGIFGSVIDEITPEYIAELEVPIPTDESVLVKVAHGIVEAEAHRQAAIHGLNRSLSLLEAALPELA